MWRKKLVYSKLEFSCDKLRLHKCRAKITFALKGRCLCVEKFDNNHNHHDFEPPYSAVVYTGQHFRSFFESDKFVMTVSEFESRFEEFEEVGGKFAYFYVLSCPTVYSRGSTSLSSMESVTFTSTVHKGRVVFMS